MDLRSTSFLLYFIFHVWSHLSTGRLFWAEDCCFVQNKQMGQWLDLLLHLDFWVEKKENYQEEGKYSAVWMNAKHILFIIFDLTHFLYLNVFLTVLYSFDL